MLLYNSFYPLHWISAAFLVRTYSQTCQTLSGLLEFTLLLMSFGIKHAQSASNYILRNKKMFTYHSEFWQLWWQPPSSSATNIKLKETNKQKIQDICYKIDVLTCARNSIACVSRVARAGVTPTSVVTSCIAMTPISATSTFIHICSSQVTYGKIATTNNHIRKQVHLKGSTITAKHTPTLPFLTVFSSAKKIIVQSALVWQLDMEITAKLHWSIRICIGMQHWISVSWIVIDVNDFGWMNVIQMILHYVLNFNALHMILTTNTRLNIIYTVI